MKPRFRTHLRSMWAATWEHRIYFYPFYLIVALVGLAVLTKLGAARWVALSFLVGVLALSYAVGFVMDVYGARAGLLSDAPAGWLIRSLKFVFTKKSFDHIFSQVVIDGREEYFEAMSQNRRYLARYRLAQLYGSLAVAIIMWIGVSTVRKFIQMWKIG